MSRYDQQRSRGDQYRDDGRDRRPDREPSRNEEPPRSSFYPSGGYGFNPGEYGRSDSGYADRAYGQNDRYNREFDRGSGQRYNEGDDLSRNGPAYEQDASYGRSGSSSPRQGWGFWGQGVAEDPRNSSHSSGAQEQRRYRQGPKGYSRSDERVCEDICEQLMSSYDIDSSEVTVTVKDGKVTLDGTVPERWMKHSIEDVADHCAGVRDVDNRVRVSQERSA